LEDRLSIQGFSDVTALYPVADQLLVSTRESTMLLELQPETRVCSIDTKMSASPTLAVGSVSDELFLHVGSELVTLRQVGSGLATESSWQTSQDKEIVTAAISGDLVVAAARGGEVFILQGSSENIRELW
jgi:hypothetical protein